MASIDETCGAGKIERCVVKRNISTEVTRDFLVSLAFVRSFSMAVRKNSRYGRTELQNIRRDFSRPFTQVQPTRSTQAHLLNTLHFSRCCHLLLPSNNKHINVSSVGAPSSPMACLEEFTAFCTIVIPTRLWSAMIDLPPGIEY